MSQSIENKVISQIYGRGRGWAFTKIDFVVNRLEVIFSGRRNELMGRNENQLLISSNQVSSADLDSTAIPSPRSSWSTPTFSCSRSWASLIS